MSRISPQCPPYKEELQSAFDRVMPKGMPPLLLFRTLATSNRAWQKFSNASLLDRGPLSLRFRELVITRTCARTQCEYEWAVHIQGFSKAAGFTEEEIAATVHGDGSSACWSDSESALVRTIDALHERATLSDEEYETLAAHFRNDEILEVFLLAGFYRTVSYLCNGLDLPLEETTSRFPKAPI